MRWVRSTWLLRGTALLLVAAMLPALLAPTIQAGSPSSSYAEWIRAQLRLPADETVDAAIAEAVHAKARTFKAFAAAFVEAYEARHPHESAAHVFVDRDLSNEALIDYLQRRFTEIGGEAVLVRIRAAVAAVTSSLTLGTSGTLTHDGDGPPAARWAVVSAPRLDAFAAAPRPFSPVRPQGP